MSPALAELPRQAQASREGKNGRETFQQPREVISPRGLEIVRVLNEVFDNLASDEETDAAEIVAFAR